MLVTLYDNNSIPSVPQKRKLGGVVPEVGSTVAGGIENMCIVPGSIGLSAL